MKTTSRIRQFQSVVGMSESIRFQSWVDLVWEAVRGKYQDLRRDVVGQWMSEASALNENSEAAHDVVRQFGVLKRIESDWRHQPLSRQSLLELYAEIYGLTSTQIRWRTEPVTLEFGFVTPVPAAEIEIRLVSYWALLERANELSGEADVSQLVSTACEILWRLLYIHPFPDGNGRTARMMLNLALRRWRLPYVAVPKVRNSPEWLAALQQAMIGDDAALQQQIERLLETSIKQVESLLASRISRRFAS